MNRFENAMAVFKLLNKSSCKECGRPTCLAFAAAVFKGEARLGECPHVDAALAARHDDVPSVGQSAAAEMAARAEQLKTRLADLDLADAARRLGGRFHQDRLTLKVLGKDFSVDAHGRFYSDIHVHEWITEPLMDHLINGRGVPASGGWVALRELEGGKSWDNFFVHRCEKPLKLVADTYTELFADMVDLFAGRPAENFHHSDVSIVLHPLPLVPLLICYWKPEEGMESSLNLFFDQHVDKNLSVGSLYTLGTGLANMFTKISHRHGV